ncbi:MAG: hypothetical protein ACOC58_03680, partial [Chloroflexota bacterium]
STTLPPHLRVSRHLSQCCLRSPVPTIHCSNTPHIPVLIPFSIPNRPDKQEPDTYHTLGSE